MLFEVQRDLISPMSYLTVSCRSLGFPPASQMALDVSLQAAVLSPSQLGSADCNGADCSGAPPSSAHTDTSIQVTCSRAELQARFLLTPEQPGAVTLQRFVALLCKVAALQLADRQALCIPYQDSAPAHSPTWPWRGRGSYLMLTGKLKERKCLKEVQESKFPLSKQLLHRQKLIGSRKNAPVSCSMQSRNCRLPWRSDHAPLLLTALYAPQD